MQVYLEDLDKDDSDNEDGEDDEDDDLSHDDAASILECLCTQLSIVQRLIVVLGLNFRISYSLSSHPDHRYFTTLSNYILVSEIICGLRLVDVPADYILTFLCRDCLLEGCRLSL